MKFKGAYKAGIAMGKDSATNPNIYTARINRNTMINYVPSCLFMYIDTCYIDGYGQGMCVARCDSTYVYISSMHANNCYVSVMQVYV